ncbi:MAG: hypothetical protein HUU37_02085 [Bdellovibrionales bacterium]|nr:hypothetical protein [Bdellovibrionales bacterium]
MMRWTVRVGLAALSLAVATGIWGVKKRFSQRQAACESSGGSAEVCSRLTYGFSDWIDAWGSEYAPTMPSDSRMRLLIARRPELVAAHAYCYFLHRRWFDPARITPDAFARSVEGFSIVRSELATWREARGGLAPCYESVRRALGVEAQDPESLLDRFDAVVVVNPLALGSTQGTWKSLMREVSRVLVHEKIHVFQQLCAPFAERAKAEWASLSREAREEMMRAHPGYNWADPEVAARERAAFLHEKDPGALASVYPECSR